MLRTDRTPGRIRLPRQRLKDGRTVQYSSPCLDGQNHRPYIHSYRYLSGTEMKQRFLIQATASCCERCDICNRGNSTRILETRVGQDSVGVNVNGTRL